MMSTLTFLVALLQPAVLNGDRIDRGETSDVSEAIRGLDEGWGGYAVPRVPGHHGPCGGGGVLSLENGGWQRRGQETSRGELALFFRVEGGHVSRLRILGAECDVDAGGRTVSWWSVSESDSLALLDELARTGEEELAEDAVAALALHASGEATSLLETLARSHSAGGEVREKAVFWLGAARGEPGLQALARLAGRLDEPHLREKVAFALHVSQAEGATHRLVEMAKTDPALDVRAKALFWLSQEAGEVATRALVDAVANDPDVRIKEKAVFALSQLPPEEGVPRLIDVAETHPEPPVRKKAMFWLGQSNDPRALALFERILLER